MISERRCIYVWLWVATIFVAAQSSVASGLKIKHVERTDLPNHLTISGDWVTREQWRTAMFTDSFDYILVNRRGRISKLVNIAKMLKVHAQSFAAPTYFSDSEDFCCNTQDGNLCIVHLSNRSGKIFEITKGKVLAGSPLKYRDTLVIVDARGIVHFRDEQGNPVNCGRAKSDTLTPESFKPEVFDHNTNFVFQLPVALQDGAFVYSIGLRKYGEPDESAFETVFMSPKTSDRFEYLSFSIFNGDSIPSPAACSPTGNAIIGYSDGRLESIDPHTGKVMWSRRYANCLSINQQPTITESGLVAFGSARPQQATPGITKFPVIFVDPASGNVVAEHILRWPICSPLVPAQTKSGDSDLVFALTSDFKGVGYGVALNAKGAISNQLEFVQARKMGGFPIENGFACRDSGGFDLVELFTE